MTSETTGRPLEMPLRAIGVVRSRLKRRGKHDCRDVAAEIVLDNGLTGALDNLDDFSHIIVIYWMHRAHASFPMKVHSRGRDDVPLVGVFASRSPDRPNPLGHTVVRLLEKRANILKVKGLDAIDGTPVIDIKPYIPKMDAAGDATAPPWTEWMSRD